MKDLVRRDVGDLASTSLGVSGARLVDQADFFAAQARSDATRRGYASDCAVFERWCADHALVAFPASEATLREFVADQALAGVAPSTIERRLSSLSVVHRHAGVPNAARSPAVRDTLFGVRRAWAEAGGAQRSASALEVDLLRRIVAGMAGEDGLVLRDRALLLTGFGAALRRSELVGLRWWDLERAPGRGLLLRLRLSKGDRAARGTSVALPLCGGAFCPVGALEAWRAWYGRAAGAPVFPAFGAHGVAGERALSAQSVTLVLRRRAEAVGIDASRFSAHSLRSGFVTSAVRAGAALDKIREVTRHRSLDVLVGYVREVDAFRDHAAGALLGGSPD